MGSAAGRFAVAPPTPIATIPRHDQAHDPFAANAAQAIRVTATTKFFTGSPVMTALLAPIAASREGFRIAATLNRLTLYGLSLL